MMDSIGRYIVGTTLGAFTLIVVSLTAVVWVTHALRDIDIITNQGQGVLAFIGITALLIPFLVLVVAPLALIIAVAYTLNRLNADSEIVVMNASGMSPWRVFAPFLTVAVLVALLVGAISAYIAPKALREMRTQLTKVRADLIANLMQPGRFATLDRQRLTVHVRERRPNGDLAGIFIDDRRDPNERGTFIAEHGQVVESTDGTFLLLGHGSAQRVSVKEPDPTIVLFDRYAFDLTPFTGSDTLPDFNVTERYLWELIWPSPDDETLKADPGRRWRELHDRLAAPLYPLAFVVIGFAILGAPRTSRQNRSMSILMTVALVAAVRLSGFAVVVLSARQPSAVYGLYALLFVTVGAGLMIISRGTIIEPPAFAITLSNAIQARLAKLRGGPAASGAPA